MATISVTTKRGSVSPDPLQQARHSSESTQSIDQSKAKQSEEGICVVLETRISMERHHTRANGLELHCPNANRGPSVKNSWAALVRCGYSIKICSSLCSTTRLLSRDMNTSRQSLPHSRKTVCVAVRTSNPRCQFSLPTACNAIDHIPLVVLSVSLFITTMTLPSAATNTSKERHVVVRLYNNCLKSGDKT